MPGSILSPDPDQPDGADAPRCAISLRRRKTDHPDQDQRAAKAVRWRGGARCGGVGPAATRPRALARPRSSPARRPVRFAPGSSGTRGAGRSCALCVLFFPSTTDVIPCAPGNWPGERSVAQGTRERRSRGPRRGAERRARSAQGVAPPGPRGRLHLSPSVSSASSAVTPGEPRLHCAAFPACRGLPWRLGVFA